MPNTYLTTSFKDREQVKALGARWDPEAKKWFVPDGRDLGPFASWLSASTSVVAGVGSSLDALVGPGAELPVSPKGVSLSRLLAGVASVVAQAYRAGAWTMAEVLKVDARRGHVYLELAERDAQGVSVAQARGVIWADTAAVIIPSFEQATGVVLGAGIKLLVRAKPTVHALYGMSLVIDAIDPEYTLGDLEARKREIRQRLQREGLFELNRSLPAPWDFNLVLVVAPQGAAGLGDFEAEASRLERWGVCRFELVFSRFQGEGAAHEILFALNQAMGVCRGSGVLPDAVVIIRGGGAVNDLAWLNDYELARCVCELEVPVFTGIGHERDNTVLDEVAHTRFDTPSKVILGIEKLILRRVQETKTYYAGILEMSRQAAQGARRAVEQADRSVRDLSLRQVSEGRERCRAHLGTVQLESQRSLRRSAQDSQEAFALLGRRALAEVASARAAVPALLARVQSDAQSAVRSARAESAAHLHSTLERARVDTGHAGDAVERGLREVSGGAEAQLQEGRERSQALVREITGQGPDKALGRGFAIVRAGSQTVTSIRQVQTDQTLELQLRDGRVLTRVNRPADFKETDQ